MNGQAASAPPAHVETVERLSAAMCGDMIEREAGQRFLVLTAAFRDELVGLMLASEKPDAVLRIGIAIYSQALNAGDTSACVEILLDAVHGTRRCVDRTVRGAAWAVS